jgi:hypothetical protein
MQISKCKMKEKEKILSFTLCSFHFAMREGGNDQDP